MVTCCRRAFPRHHCVCHPASQRRGLGKKDFLGPNLTGGHRGCQGSSFRRRQIHCGVDPARSWRLRPAMPRRQRACTPPSGTGAVRASIPAEHVAWIHRSAESAGKHSLILIVHGSGGTDVIEATAASTARTMKFALHSVEPVSPPRSGTSLEVVAAKDATTSALHSSERTDETVAAFDHLQRRDDIDPARIGLWAISEAPGLPNDRSAQTRGCSAHPGQRPGRNAEDENQYFAFNRLIHCDSESPRRNRRSPRSRRAYSIANAEAHTRVSSRPSSPSRSIRSSAAIGHH